MNTAKLKGRMKENGITQEVLAAMIGISLSTLNRKITNEDGDSFTIKEANAIFKALNLSPDDAVAIFFADNVA